MNRALRRLIASVILIVSGCGSSALAPSPSPVLTHGATVADASSTASLAASVAPSTFPTAAFAALPDGQTPEAAATKLQAALASVARGGGVAATVMTPEGTWTGAVGTADGVHDLSIDSQFGIGSVTKSVVAAQVMRLVEAAQVSLDEPAATYLPAGFAFDTNGATVRELLSHRSGIPDWYGDTMEQRMAADRGRVWKLDEVLALAGSERRPAGTFGYADTNYNVLGLVIEHVSGRPLGAVLRDGVLRVDGTARLIYQPDEAPTEPLAMPRGESGAALAMGGGYLPSISDASSAGGAGAMASDTISLARWWRAFCAGEIVSVASLIEMSTFFGNADLDYGLGLFDPLYATRFAPAVGHLGSNFGYEASAGCLTEAPVVFVVLTNDVTIESQALATSLVKAALSN